MREIAVLFARADSVYKTMPGCDVWDIERDARNWPGGCPVVAHPPCARWSLINGVVLSRYPHKAAEFAWGNDGGLFAFALSSVRRFGGVIEHPRGSRAFDHFALPRVGRMPDEFGGWTTEVRQVDFGHRAEKRTWLYICGVNPDDIPRHHQTGERPVAAVMRMAHSRTRELMDKAERERTPLAFAQFLVNIARQSFSPSRRMPPPCGACPSRLRAVHPSHPPTLARTGT